VCVRLRLCKIAQNASAPQKKGDALQVYTAIRFDTSGPLEWLGDAGVAW
jgi:hypothetical protein